MPSRSTPRRQHAHPRRPRLAPGISAGDFKAWYWLQVFADPANSGRSLRDAAAAWNVVKRSRGDHRYRRQR